MLSRSALFFSPPDQNTLFMTSLSFTKTKQIFVDHPEMGLASTNQEREGERKENISWNVCARHRRKDMRAKSQ